ncbi:RING/U-box superfamily protein [Striga asiatica]|uniref:RING/U-box superfamily protein n=1 Tax=Striga asiatica TaxID=4170 RepID=A0A5A7PFV7_STRAF|nr:RING/U-box superfamily protein [Striga asiatica]
MLSSEKILGVFNPVTATFDPGVGAPVIGPDVEFPVLSPNLLRASKRSRGSKRQRESLKNPIAPTHIPIATPPMAEGPQPPQPQRWSFRDMVNKHRDHVDIDPDAVETVERRVRRRSWWIFLDGSRKFGFPRASSSVLARSGKTW